MKALKLGLAVATLFTGLSAQAGFWREIGKIVDALPASSSSSSSSYPSRDYDRDRGYHNDRDYNRDYDRDRDYRNDRDRRDREDRDRRDRRDRDQGRSDDRRGGQPPADNCGKVTSDVQSMQGEFAKIQGIMDQAVDECGTGWVCKSEYQPAYDAALRHLQDAQRLRDSVCR